MAFKRSHNMAASPPDPVQLYRMLAETNSGPESLWYHQGTVLHEWFNNHCARSDVAIELPTGAGKTLVGGLIGEYRRRVFGERVAYLCPTRQLARQTADKLTEYGIPNVLLVGKVAEWNKADRAKYTSGSAVAVSVYSHVFNSNPALNDAQLLLLDDAHAAESAVAGPWSLEISRVNEQSAYFDVLSALTDAIDPLVQNQLNTHTSDSRYSNAVYLASPLGVADQATHLEQVLSAAVETGKITREGTYAFQFLRGHLDQCMVYLSEQRLLIRPLIPPTMAHTAFDNPDRRVYMSATLGAGGELERVFGRRKITRIPIPEGWQNQGTGRRLFCFPQQTSDLALSPEKVAPWVAKVVAEHNRAVILNPDSRTADNFTDTCLPTGAKVLKAEDVEDDLAEFTSESNAALVLNNRYDGIDLPDEDCRLVVLNGLPARGDLQERFLHSSLSASEVLQERIRARIMQGAGRASRNAKDFAAVLVLDDDLVSYVTRRDVQEGMHPEIHAELEFGYQNSTAVTSDDMLDNLRIFAEHGEEWREVDQDIVENRERYERIDTVGTDALQRAAPHEVAACDAIWQREWSLALNCIRKVLDGLRGGRASQRYAALWNYLASSIACRIAQQTGDSSFSDTAESFYAAARAAGRGTFWLSYLDTPTERKTTPAKPALDPLNEQAMNGVLDNADRLVKPTVFDTEVQRAREALLDTPHKPYENALVFLGKLAGAVPSEGDGNNDSAPDAIWIFGSALWVVWEAKSEAKPEGELGSDDVRQAGGHLRFIATKRGDTAPGDSPVLLVTPQEQFHPTARAVAEGHVYVVRPNQVIDLFDRLVRTWRSIRARDHKSLSLENIADLFSAEGVLPTQWLHWLCTIQLKQNRF
ncbi:DEAD/DEAH box helicase [Actinopolyspora halophila]|uniref:DEAD/DEAH box helicase n=1 Tax=Actinopolyspora halophila TaxID=1850 RepID=UPI0009FE3955|nr:DEAD/DEAH box helicase [Actinopolyspora halophila]